LYTKIALNKKPDDVVDDNVYLFRIPPKWSKLIKHDNQSKDRPLFFYPKIALPVRIEMLST